MAMSKIDQLKVRGFNESVIELVDSLDEVVKRRLIVDLLALTDDQVKRFNYYDNELRKRGK